jgi:diadenosine tetraphosphatase ApaH/serine/threonine PP2A family protein phosphatase
VALVAEADAVCVAGNHDLMAIDRLDDGHAGALARESLVWTRTVLSDDARAYLEALPPTAEVEGVVVAHGSLHDPTVYVESDRAAAELARLGAERPDARLLVLGHTHTPLAYGDQRGALLEGRAGQVSIEGEERLLVNAGSVGQPREWRALARFALIDLDAGVVRYRALSYDDAAVRRALADAGLPPDACHRRPPFRRAARTWLSRTVGRRRPRSRR